MVAILQTGILSDFSKGRNDENSSEKGEIKREK